MLSSIKSVLFSQNGGIYHSFSYFYEGTQPSLVGLALRFLFVNVDFLWWLFRFIEAMILSRWINVCRSFGVNKGCYIRAQSSYESSPGIIDGRAIAKALKNELKVQVAGLRDKHVIPGLAVILLGDRKDSATYVKMKQKACTQIGINSQVYGYPVSEPEEEILKKGRVASSGNL